MPEETVVTETTPAEDDFAAYRASRVASPAVEVEPEVSETPEAVEQPEVETKDAEESETSENGEGEKKKGGYQRRIDKLTKEKGELAARLDALERQLSPKGDVQPKDAGAKQEPQAATSKPAKPELKDFDSYEAFDAAKDEYFDKLSDWKIEQLKQQNEQATAQQRAAAEQATKQTEWGKRLDAAKARIKDFDDVVKTAIAENEVQVSEAMGQTIMESENGPDLIYFLAKNPSEAERIAKLSPMGAARELGKIEAKLSVSPEPKTAAVKAVTTAPPPIKPVAAQAKTVQSLDDAGDDFQKYKTIRLKQQRR